MIDGRRQTARTGSILSAVQSRPEREQHSAPRGNEGARSRVPHSRLGSGPGACRFGGARCLAVSMVAEVEERRRSNWRTILCTMPKGCCQTTTPGRNPEGVAARAEARPRHTMAAPPPSRAKSETMQTTGPNYDRATFDQAERTHARGLSMRAGRATDRFTVRLLCIHRTKDSRSDGQSWPRARSEHQPLPALRAPARARDCARHTVPRADISSHC